MSAHFRLTNASANLISYFLQKFSSITTSKQVAAEQAAAEQAACPLNLPIGDIYSAETQYSVRMMDKPVCCILLCVKCYLHIGVLSICPMTPFDKQKVKSNKQKRTTTSKQYKKKRTAQDKQKGKVKSKQEGKTKKGT